MTNARPSRSQVLYKYRMDAEDYAALSYAQDHCCALCLKPPTPKRPLSVDHDHACCHNKVPTCGACVRGLLCTRCNLALGYLERAAKDKGWLGRALLYLAQPYKEFKAGN